MLVGSKIRDIRKERGLTLNQLAQKLDVSASFLSLIERDVKKPSLNLLQNMSSLLNITLPFLMSDPMKDAFTGIKLKDIRKSRGLSIEDLGELSEVPAEIIRNIENNLAKPSLEELEKLSTALNVTLQYFVEKSSAGNNLGDKIKSLREKKGISQAHLADMASISASLVSQIENNIAVPSLETLDRLAECLNVETSYLLIDTSNTSHNLSSLNPEIISLLGDLKVQAILTAVRDFEPGEIKFILNLLEWFRANRKLLSENNTR